MLLSKTSTFVGLEQGENYTEDEHEQVTAQNLFSFCKISCQKYCHNKFLKDIQLCHGVLENKQGGWEGEEEKGKKKGGSCNL